MILSLFIHPGCAIVDSTHSMNDGLLLEGSILCWSVITLLDGQGFKHYHQQVCC